MLGAAAPGARLPVSIPNTPGAAGRPGRGCRRGPCVAPMTSRVPVWSAPLLRGRIAVLVRIQSPQGDHLPQFPWDSSGFSTNALSQEPSVPGRLVGSAIWVALHPAGAARPAPGLASGCREQEQRVVCVSAEPHGQTLGIITHTPLPSQSHLAAKPGTPLRWALPPLWCEHPL